VVVRRHALQHRLPDRARPRRRRGRRHRLRAGREGRRRRRWGKEASGWAGVARV
jgi:hypothetical protein